MAPDMHSPRAFACAAVAGFALSRVGAVYNTTTLILASFSFPTLITIKLIKAGVFAALALLFYLDAASGTARPGLDRSLLHAAWAALGVYLAVELCADFLQATSFGLQIMGLVLAGVSEALCVYLYASAMARLPGGPAVMLLGFAATNALSALLATFFGDVSTYLLLAFRVAGLAALGPCIGSATGEDIAAGPGQPAANPGQAAGARAQTGTAGNPGQAAGARAQADTANESTHGGEVSQAALSRLAQRGAFVAACFLVNAVAGFYVSIPAVGGVALNGAEKSIMGTLRFLVELGAYGALALRPGLAARPSCLHPALALCLVGLLFMPWYVEPVGTRLGIAVVRVGRDLFEALSWVIAMEVARNAPAKGRPLLCLVLAVSSFYFGAPFAKLLEEPIAASELAFSQANVAAGVILAGCVALVGASCGRGWSAGEASGDAGPRVSTRADGAKGYQKRLASFDQGVSALISELSLDERETAVLVDTVHGFSGEATGARLGYSRDAVKSTLAKIYAKAGVSSRQELVEAIEARGREERD